MENLLGDLQKHVKSSSSSNQGVFDFLFFGTDEFPQDLWKRSTIFFDTVRFFLIHFSLGQRVSLSTLMNVFGLKIVFGERKVSFSALRDFCLKKKFSKKKLFKKYQFFDVSI